MINSEKNRQIVIKSFSNLEGDEAFKIVDGPNPNYNCIAWAANVTTEWWECLPLDKRPYVLDGVKYNWPFEVDAEFSVRVLKEIFEKLGYEECNDWKFEEGFKKVAFYEKDGKATHAARQLTFGLDKGVWSSKLGRAFLIHHGNPHTIANSPYGEAVYFMKKSMK